MVESWSVAYACTAGLLGFGTECGPARDREVVWREDEEEVVVWVILWSLGSGPAPREPGSRLLAQMATHNRWSGLHNIADGLRGM